MFALLLTRTRPSPSSAALWAAANQSFPSPRRAPKRLAAPTLPLPWMEPLLICISNTLQQCSTPLWVEYKTFQQKKSWSQSFKKKVIINPADENSKKNHLSFFLPGFQSSTIYSDILLFGDARNCELPNLKSLRQLHVQLLINHFQLQRLHQPTTGVAAKWHVFDLESSNLYGNGQLFELYKSPNHMKMLDDCSRDSWRKVVWGRTTHRSPAYQ